jgi:acetyl-CoA C-acetyltransferase
VSEAVSLALNDAHLDMNAIDGVVNSLAPDALPGIGNAERLAVDAVGAVNKRFDTQFFIAFHGLR